MHDSVEESKEEEGRRIHPINLSPLSFKALVIFEWLSACSVQAIDVPLARKAIMRWARKSWRIPSVAED